MKLEKKATDRRLYAKSVAGTSGPLPAVNSKLLLTQRGTAKNGQHSPEEGPRASKINITPTSNICLITLANYKN